MLNICLRLFLKIFTKTKGCFCKIMTTENHVSKISVNVNFTTIHVVKKMEELDDGKGILKACIEPHGKKI